MKKRLWAYILCAAVLVSGLGGCGNASQSSQSPTQDTESSDISSETESEENEAMITISDISSTDLVADMKIGWNLGNTLDATGGMGISSEWSWGNPKTSQEMIDAILDAGFNVVRIPVTWEGHFGAAAEYKIQDKWLERVKEVVDYAYAKGAYVILNMHHEEWHTPTEENKEAACAQIAALWTQIAEYFKDYDEHLIFEGLNEPRKKGTSVEWTGDKEGAEVINQFMQVFVDTVRATGGNNTYRHLMITGYAASSSESMLKKIVLPEDEKLIVSVHAYTPYNFALNVTGTSSWSEKSDSRDIDSLFETIDELFLSKGVPVIIGEFGAMNKDNEAERVEWVTYYLTKAKEYGVPCVWWDNNSFTGDGEKFGLLDRRALEFPYKELLNAMMAVYGLTPSGNGNTSGDVNASEGDTNSTGKEEVSLEGKKLLAITVDDGPDGSGTDGYIKLAEAYNAPLTFFVLGQNIEKNTSQLQKMLDAGCEIGNHSTTHGYFTNMTAEEIKNEIAKTNALITQYAPDAEVNFFRAPYFAYNDTVYNNVEYPIIDAAKAEVGTDYQATLNVLLGAEDGDIILLHSWNTASLQALEAAIPQLRENGFEFVTVSSLFEEKDMEPVDGTVYRSIKQNLSGEYQSVENLFTGSNSVSGDWNNWTTAVDLSIDKVASLKEGQAIKVEYQATIGPCLILQSWSGGPNWIQMTASSDDGSTAIFTYEDIIAAYGGTLETLNASMIRPYGADITVTSVDIVGK